MRLARSKRYLQSSNANNMQARDLSYRHYRPVHSVTPYRGRGTNDAGERLSDLLFNNLTTPRSWPDLCCSRVTSKTFEREVVCIREHAFRIISNIVRAGGHCTRQNYSACAKGEHAGNAPGETTESTNLLWRSIDEHNHHPAEREHHQVRREWISHTRRRL